METPGVRKVILLKQCYVWTNPSKFVFKKIDIKNLKGSQVNTSYPPKWNQSRD
jgi:hypothetical protein